MPGGDRTGPMGAGPLTGRGAGFCGGAGQPGYLSTRGGRFNRGGNRGFGFGGGGYGRGWRNNYWATGVPGWARNRDPEAEAAYYRPAPQDNVSSAGDAEMAALRSQLVDIGTALADINRRLDGIEKKKG